MNIKESIKKHFFYRQHPDAALRYWPIVQLIKKEHLQNTAILEIGSGSLGIAPYLKNLVTGVDVQFEESQFPLLRQVKASALNLPFTSSQFDVVILSDVLEHLPKAQRGRAIKEAVRVCSQMLIVSGPFGKEALRQDRELSVISLKRLGKQHHYFAEHLGRGLPELKDIRKIIVKDKKVKSVTVKGPYFNLTARKQIMNLYLSRIKLFYYLYLKGVMFIVPVLRLLNSPPGYRYVIVARML
ncbi:methyltransferase domain-containing protein [Patescibacteria group bacterium]|nr:methyltransferase domain-containing protein [Patescibacteria group bacterium]